MEPNPATRDQHALAYQHGQAFRAQNPSKNLDDAQAEMALEWNRKRGTSGLSWDEVAHSANEGWNRITEMGEGD